MGRGRSLRTIKKEAYWVAKAQEKARLQAQVEAWQTKPFDMKIWAILQPVIDKIDPLELVAVVGGTIVCHEIILKTQEFADKLPDLLILPTQTYWGVLLHSLGVPGAQQVAEDLGSAITEGIDVAEATFNKSSLGNITVWLISFGISYFVFRHGGSMLGVANLFFGLAK